MFAKRTALFGAVCMVAVFSLNEWEAAAQKGVEKKQKKKEEPTAVWTNASDPTLPADFKFQGEYYAKMGDKVAGCQVIALGKGAFQAVVCKGGLPGMGWNGKDKALMEGKLEGDKAVFVPATGKRRYLAQSPAEFSATDPFPPAGQKAFTATIAGEVMSLQMPDGKSLEMKKLARKSPTLGAKAPADALVLFDSKNTDQLNGGRLDAKTGILNTDGKDITTKRKFTDYTAHVEFMLAYRPEARSQGRGNSGFYQVDLYEVQILDSFGLEGKNNECGGVYQRLAPKVNMCLPPLTWQTYDVEFTSAVRDSSGKKIKNARITLKHNGEVIHDNAEITSPTGGSRKEPEGTPGVLRLQGHGNPTQFRNFWVVEKK